MLECSIQKKTITWSDAERITGIREGELRDRITNVMQPESAPDEGGVAERSDVLSFEQVAELQSDSN
jgi:hypothetical protein